MIFCDRIELERCRGIHPNLARAINWLLAHDLAALPMGETVVDGEHVFVNRFDYQTSDVADEPFETHRRYADIHLLLGGEECVAVAGLAAHQVIGTDEAQDWVGSRGPAECLCTMTPEKALVVFPGEAHRSKQAHELPHTVQKLVCKVRME